MEAKEVTSRADDRGFRAAITILQSPLHAALVVSVTVVKTIVPKNMAEAMVDSGAVAEAENPSIVFFWWLTDGAEYWLSTVHRVHRSSDVWFWLHHQV